MISKMKITMTNMLCTFLIMLFTTTFANAALPPGIEDVLFCPRNYCLTNNPKAVYKMGRLSSLKICKMKPMLNTYQPDFVPVTVWGTRQENAKQRLETLLKRNFHENPCEDDGMMVKDENSYDMSSDAFDASAFNAPQVGGLTQPIDPGFGPGNGDGGYLDDGGYPDDVGYPSYDSLQSQKEVYETICKKNSGFVCKSVKNIDLRNPAGKQMIVCRSKTSCAWFNEANGKFYNVILHKKKPKKVLRISVNRGQLQSILDKASGGSMSFDEMDDERNDVMSKSDTLKSNPDSFVDIGHKIIDDVAGSSSAAAAKLPMKSKTSTATNKKNKKAQEIVIWCGTGAFVAFLIGGLIYRRFKKDASANYIAIDTTNFISQHHRKNSFYQSEQVYESPHILNVV